ncbi:glycosyltransferase [Actinomadura sp. NAK00032]|nr:glycosyltransferase [Actinomadura sp. NAK00032]
MQRVQTMSVITPVYKPDPELLREAYDSLAGQELPNDWEWEWIVQEDGTTGVAENILPADPRIKFGTGRRGSSSLTRNLGLARSRGELIKNLDADDVLTPGVLARDIEVLSSDQGVHWTASRALDLLPDGSTVSVQDRVPPGRLEPGVVFEQWKADDFRLPVHPTTLCIRRNLATALGGWMAVPGSDDSGLLISASMVSAGHFHGEIGLLYRKWPGQVTAQPAHYAETEWNSRMSLIRERAESFAEIWSRRGLLTP